MTDIYVNPNVIRFLVVKFVYNRQSNSHLISAGMVFL